MGRLVAYTANRRDGLEAALRFERHALRPPATKSEAAWGIAFYQGDEVLHKKRPLPAGSAPEWTDLGGGVSTDCALMHLREPTVGDFRTENTHPFRFRRWTFAHQGTVSTFADLSDTVGPLPERAASGLLRELSDLNRAQVDAPDVARVEAYPTLFQPWLRRVVVWRTGAVEVGPLSLLVPGPIPFVRREVPADGAVLALEATPEAALFRWFANDAVAPSRGRDADGRERVRLEDVRYGFFGTTDALWGIEAPVEGDRLGPVHRYRSAMPDAGRTLAAMLRLTFQGP